MIKIGDVVNLINGKAKYEGIIDGVLWFYDYKDPTWWRSDKRCISDPPHIRDLNNAVLKLSDFERRVKVYKKRVIMD